MRKPRRNAKSSASIIGHDGFEFEIHWALDKLEPDEQCGAVLTAMFNDNFMLARHPDYGPVLYHPESPFNLCIVPEATVRSLEDGDLITPVPSQPTVLKVSAAIATIRDCQSKALH